MPQPLQNCSHQAKPKKAASGAHPKKQSPSRFCVQAIAGVQPQKSRNVAFGAPKNNEKQWKRVAFGTPKNNEIVPQPLRNCSHQAKPKKAASGAHPKKQSPSRFCVQAIAGVQPQKSRNVAFGTLKNNENVLLLEPLKTMKSCPSHCETAATRQISQWLGNDFIVFGGSKSNTFSLFFIVFRGAKSNVSRFLRLYSCNGLDAKPAGALLFRMRSRRSFLGFCLVAAVSQWLGHDFIVFRGSKSNTFSLFLRVPKATFRDFWGCTPAMAWTQNLLGLCFFGCAPDAAFLGFAWWLQFRSGWGTISLFLGVPNATFFGMRSRRSFLGLCLVAAASKSYVALCLAWGNLSQPFFFVFSRFQKQRFGTFLAAVSYGVGTILLSF